MKRVVRVVAVLLVACFGFLADTQPPVAMGASSAFPSSQGRVCPPARPYPVNGTMKHRKRDAQVTSGSDRFLVRLADEDDNPDRVIDHAITAPDGTYKLCYAQSDIISSPETFAVRAFSAYVPDGASWITVQKTDAAWDGTFFTHLYSIAWNVSDLGLPLVLDARSGPTSTERWISCATTPEPLLQARSGRCTRGDNGIACP